MNVQFEDILVANNLPRHRKLITERRKIMESEMPDPRTMGAGTGGGGVQTFPAPAIMGAAPLQQHRTMW